MPCAARVYFWASGATAPLGLKWGLFGYTFPFEGNWNFSYLKLLTILTCLWLHLPVWRELKRLASMADRNTIIFGYTFPFEGNWNPRAAGLWERSAKISLATPSRLKGIETYSRDAFHFKCLLWLHLPVWRELKQMFLAPTQLEIRRLWLHLPVWRELKLTVSANVSANVSLWLHLPVWRELKLFRPDSHIALRTPTLATPSRLKGIETLSVDVGVIGVFTSLATPSRLKGIETILRNIDTYLIKFLWLHLPVWRELKPMWSA